MNPPFRLQPQQTRQSGLTMVEVLIALAVTAIAVLAAGQAVRAMTHASMRQAQSLLAQTCAENALVAARLVRQFPALGSQTGECEQLGRVFHVEISVADTANPSFRRVQAKVSEGNEQVLSLVTVIGRY